jgi:hypothetical protein
VSPKPPDSPFAEVTHGSAFGNFLPRAEHTAGEKKKLSSNPIINSGFLAISKVYAVPAKAATSVENQIPPTIPWYLYMSIKGAFHELVFSASGRALYYSVVEAG